MTHIGHRQVSRVAVAKLILPLSKRSFEPLPCQFLSPRGVHMRRREFLGALGGTAAAWPLVAVAQGRRQVARIGILHPGSPPDPWLDGLRDGLREFGYVEGDNLVFEYRWAEGRSERLPDLADVL